jgi:hypothetical protein
MADTRPDDDLPDTEAILDQGDRLLAESNRLLADLDRILVDPAAPADDPNRERGGRTPR